MNTQKNNNTFIDEIKSLFKYNIQKNYISNYLDSFPPSESYNKIKHYLSEDTTTNILDLYDLDERKLDINNICKNNKDNINCFIGNVNLQQLTNGFAGGFENVLESLDRDKTIDKPFAKGKIDLLKYISNIASRDRSRIQNYDSYLINQIGKDMRRDTLIINNESINDILMKNDILKYYSFNKKKVNIDDYNELMKLKNDEFQLKNDEHDKLEHIECTNIIALFILKALFEMENNLTLTNMYDKLMLLLTLLHQGMSGEIMTLTNKYYDEIVKKINLELNDNNLLKISTISPELEDKSVAYKNYNDKNKYTKIIINKNEISIYSVMYNRFIFNKVTDDPHKGGHYFAVLHVDVLNNTYEIKYLTIDINYYNYNYNPTKYEQIKETVGENKTSTTVGTLLTLGALSAIPLALLLGGKKTKKRFKRGRRTVKKRTTRGRKTRTKRYKQHSIRKTFNKKYLKKKYLKKKYLKKIY
jgi:hypothetical protein